MRTAFLAGLLLAALSVSAQGGQDEIDVIDLKKAPSPKPAPTAPAPSSVTNPAPQTTKAFTYNPATTTVSKTDTLRMYSVYLDAKNTPFGTMYTANGKEIKREKYEEYKNSWEVTKSCLPCVMYTFDVNDKIKIISFQHGTCLCGEYTEYFGDGSVRVKGQFQPNTSGNWQNMKERGLCNIRIGEWYYYKANNILDKVEVYENGVLQRVEKGEMHIVPPTTPGKTN